MSILINNRSDYTGYSNEARASIQMTHSANGPKVSLEEAQRIERETAERLLNTRKLSLIVDLDQTIVHATVDPTVGDWIAEGEAWEARQTNSKVSSEAETDSAQPNKAEDDEVNPNWEVLKDVKKFRLGPESFGLPPWPDKHRTKGKERAVETQGCLYYVKPRYEPASCVVLILTYVVLKSRMV
jgi:RNA polymerase II subunit A-like phosphatase